MQIAMKGQGFPLSDVRLWQGISSAAAETESISMSVDIICRSVTDPVPAAKTANGASPKLPINRTAIARTRAR
jgi:hypothetical protein